MVFPSVFKTCQFPYHIHQTTDLHHLHFKISFIKLLYTPYQVKFFGQDHSDLGLLAFVLSLYHISSKPFPSCLFYDYRCLTLSIPFAVSYSYKIMLSQTPVFHKWLTSVQRVNFFKNVEVASVQNKNMAVQPLISVLICSVLCQVTLPWETLFSRKFGLGFFPLFLC